MFLDKILHGKKFRYKKKQFPTFDGQKYNQQSVQKYTNTCASIFARKKFSIATKAVSNNIKLN